MKNFDAFGAVFVTGFGVIFGVLFLMLAVVCFNSTLPGSISSGVMCVMMAAVCLMFPAMIAYEEIKTRR